MDFMYVQGYTAAIQDMIKVLDNGMSDDLKRHKRKQDLKTIRGILSCMLENRTILRENPDTFIRCNNDVPGGFECFDQRTKKPVKR